MIECILKLLSIQWKFIDQISGKKTSIWILFYLAKEKQQQNTSLVLRGEGMNDNNHVLYTLFSAHNTSNVVIVYGSVSMAISILMIKMN